MALEQVAQRAQALELARSVEAVAGRRARRDHEARLLDIAQHPRRPAGRRGRLVHGQGVHHA
jgi:hypothetical protein